MEVSLHTKLAINLLNGDWRDGHMGLLQFASQMTKLWTAFKADDPYAEELLIKILDVICDTMDELKEYEIELQRQTNNLRGIKVQLYTRQAQ